MIDFYKILGCTPDTVSDDDIEALKMYEEEKSYPPRIKLEFSPNGLQTTNTSVKLTLHGLHGSLQGPSLPFSKILRLGREEETGNCYMCVHLYDHANICENK